MAKIPFCFILAGILPASAATITFQQGVAPTAGYAHLSQDFRGNGAANTGAQTLVGYQSSGVLEIRTVMGFDLSAIPAGSTITAFPFFSFPMAANPAASQASEPSIFMKWFPTVWPRTT